MLAKVEQSLAVIKERPPLYEALCCYFDVDLDVARAARALHLHPNSLRYRLAKVEELIGASLRRPATIANLYLAIMIERRSRDSARHSPGIESPPISPVPRHDL
jgi:purine catabolism regulator